MMICARQKPVSSRIQSGDPCRKHKVASQPASLSPRPTLRDAASDGPDPPGPVFGRRISLPLAHRTPAVFLFSSHTPHDPASPSISCFPSRSYRRNSGRPLPFPRKPQPPRGAKTLEAARDAAWVPVMEEEGGGGASGSEEVVNLEDAVEQLVEHLVVPVLPRGQVNQEEALSPETQEDVARQVRPCRLTHCSSSPVVARLRWGFLEGRSGLRNRAWS